jgi:hypothetical protein
VQKPYALGTLLQNKKSIPAATKKAILKKEKTCVNVQRQIDDNEIEKQKTDVHFISITLGNKEIPTGVQGQDVKKPRMINDSFIHSFIYSSFHKSLHG